MLTGELLCRWAWQTAMPTEVCSLPYAEPGTAGRFCPEPVFCGMEAMQLTAQRGAPQDLNASMPRSALQQATFSGQEYAPPVWAVESGPPAPGPSALQLGPAAVPAAETGHLSRCFNSVSGGANRSPGTVLQPGARA